MFFRLLLLSACTALLAPRAAACSCGAMWRPTPTECRASERAFAGVIEGYDWPLAYEGVSIAPVAARIDVNTVWVGVVPSSVTAYTGLGGCSIAPAPGTRVVVCDDRADGEAPSFSFCNQPTMGQEAVELQEELGAGAAPRGWGLRLPSVFTLEAALYPLSRQILVLPPVMVTLVAAGFGWFRQRRRPLTAQPARPWRIVAGAGALVGAVIALRVVADQQLAPGGLEARLVAVFGPLLLAAGGGGFVAWRSQRYPGRYGRGGVGLLAALLVVSSVFVAGFARPHLPIQPVNVIACSDARAREFLATLPAEPTYRGSWDPFAPIQRAWEEEALAASAWIPNRCADWGLSQMAVSVNDSYGPCVGFADGLGGKYWRCTALGSLGYGWEAPF